MEFLQYFGLRVRGSPIWETVGMYVGDTVDSEIIKGSILTSTLKILKTQLCAKTS